MTDPRIMPKEERKILTEKLSEIDPRYRRGELEEEVIDAYDTSVKRLRAFTDKEFAKKLEGKLKKGV